MVFLPSLGGGGAERAMILLCNELVRLGHSVTLVCVRMEGRLSSLIAPQVKLVDLKAKRMSHAIVQLRGVIKEVAPAALYSTIVHANLAAILATVGMKDLRVIIRESNAPLSEKKASLSRKVTHFMAKYLYRYASGIICVSEHVANELSTMCVGVGGKVRTLPTPVVEETLFSDAEVPLSPEIADFFNAAPTIVAVARLHPQKNLGLLIDAVAALNKKFPLQLALLGEGALRTTLAEQIARYGLEARIRLVGFQSNPFNYIKAAKMLVLSSDYEGMPNVLVQALALGTPVISTDCPGGSRELLKGGGWGMLTPVGDTQALAAAIEAMLSNPQLVKVEEVVSRYGVQSSTREYLRMIELK